ncbi:hypothetical protein ABZ912_20070 [Nonomuraea angiospora]|uniref:hypothetical protein n=1 Tax=Nonomuraea angiospora TaxID=46172 RepID=UPI0033EA3D40
MADYDLPEDLIDLRRAFLASEARLVELRQTHPASTVIAASEAELSEEQRVEWAAAFDESRRLAEEIHRHGWWETVENRHSAWMALRNAAVAG